MLPLNPVGDPALRRVPELRVSKLQVPPHFVRGAERGFLEKWPRVLNLRDHLEPARRLQVHLKTKPVQKIGIIVIQLEAAVMIPLNPESFLHSKSKPSRKLAVEQHRWSEIRYQIGRLRGEGPIRVAIQKTQRIRSRPRDEGAAVCARATSCGHVVLPQNGRGGRKNDRNE